MIRFENMQQYTEWFQKEADKLGKDDRVVVEVASINRLICICGSPLAIEPAAEYSAEHFMDEWNNGIKDIEEKLDVEDDVDFISELRDVILSTLESYLKMEIVFVSTEY